MEKLVRFVFVIIFFLVIEKFGSERYELIRAGDELSLNGAGIVPAGRKN